METEMIIIGDIIGAKKEIKCKKRALMVVTNETRYFSYWEYTEEINPDNRKFFTYYNKHTKEYEYLKYVKHHTKLPIGLLGGTIEAKVVQKVKM